MCRSYRCQLFLEALYWTCWSSVLSTQKCKFNHTHLETAVLCRYFFCLGLSTRRKWIINTPIPDGTVFFLCWSNQKEEEEEVVEMRSIRKVGWWGNARLAPKMGGWTHPKMGGWDGWKSRRQTHSIHSQTIIITHIPSPQIPLTPVYFSEIGVPVFVTALVPNLARIALTHTKRYLKDRMQFQQCAEETVPLSSLKN